MFGASRHRRHTRSERAPDEHLLVFDDGCYLCQRSAEFIRARAQPPVKLVPFSELGGYRVLTALECDEILRSAHFITPDGREYHGGESITRALRLVRFGAVACLLDVWGLALVRELLYSLIAANRSLLSRLLQRMAP